MSRNISVLRLVWRLGWVAFAGFLVYLFWLPDVPALKTHNPTRTALMELREEQARAKKKKLRTVQEWKSIDQISPHLVHAVLLAEDDTFYQHRGFDFAQIRIAFQRNWEKKRYVYGGSTLTQQLARTLFLSPRKNLVRKAKEAVITVYLERTLSKKRILEIYLNVVEWGSGIYGAEAAAQHYYGISALELSPDEAVALASILPSPRRWSPQSEKGFMARRRTNIFERMQRAGYVPVEVSSDAATAEEVFYSEDTVPLDDLQGVDRIHP